VRRPPAAHTHAVWRRPEPVIDREDVNNVLFTLMDIRQELERIRILLEEDADGREDDS
jgi:hypothetical protein